MSRTRTTLPATRFVKSSNTDNAGLAHENEAGKGGASHHGRLVHDSIHDVWHSAAPPELKVGTHLTSCIRKVRTCVERAPFHEGRLQRCGGGGGERRRGIGRSRLEEQKPDEEGERSHSWRTPANRCTPKLGGFDKYPDTRPERRDRPILFVPSRTLNITHPSYTGIRIIFLQERAGKKFSPGKRQMLACVRKTHRQG